jgi:ParB family chromosome partitioning protein
MATKKEGKRALGRGLDALFGEVSVTPKAGNSGESGGKDAGQSASGDSTDGIRYVPIDDIKPNADQPRQKFGEEALEGLASSIEKHGVIQPVIVHKGKRGYELIAGERRWRAARKAGLKEIPAIVKEVTAEENALFAIIENMQREDLNPMEEAQAYRKIIDEYGLTQEEVSKSVGKSRPYIANTLRLLKLPAGIRAYIEEGKLSAGHANAIGAVTDDADKKTLAERIVRDGLSVREAEALAAAGGSGKKRRKSAVRATKNPELKAVEEELTSFFGTKAVIRGNTNRGAVELHYYSRDELDGLIEELLATKR